MNITIDDKIINSFEELELLIWFKKAGCAWTKIEIKTDFDKTDLNYISHKWKNIYYNKNLEDKLNWSKIIKKDNTYLFISPQIKERCECSSSFSFQRKLIDNDKLSKLKALNKKIAI